MNLDRFGAEAHDVVDALRELDYDANVTGLYIINIGHLHLLYCRKRDLPEIIKLLAFVDMLKEKYTFNITMRNYVKDIYNWSTESSIYQLNMLLQVIPIKDITHYCILKYMYFDEVTLKGSATATAEVRNGAVTLWWDEMTDFNNTRTFTEIITKDSYAGVISKIAQNHEYAKLLEYDRYCGNLF